MLYAFPYAGINFERNLSIKGVMSYRIWIHFSYIFEKDDKTETSRYFLLSSLLSFLSFLYIFYKFTLVIFACSGNVEDEILWFRMLHIWQSIMLAASFTSLCGILSGPVGFFEFKGFIFLFLSLGLAFDKSSFQNF